MRLAVSVFLPVCVQIGCGSTEARTEASSSLDGDGLRSTDDRDGDGLDRWHDCDDNDEKVRTPTPWYADLDGDGFGDAARMTPACAAPRHHVANGADCDDRRADVHPGATEVCNDGRDDDCDGLADDLDPNTAGMPLWFLDEDGDGHGAAAGGSVLSCTPVAGRVERGLDCDDGDPAVHPDADEVCNNQVDDNCDGAAEECVLEQVLHLPTETHSMPGSRAGDFAGWSMAGVGDVDGDGRNDLLVGAPYLDDAAYNGGGAYLVHGHADGDMSLDDAVLVGSGPEDAFAGWAVAAGDLDADGVPDLIVGAPEDDTAGVLGGIVRITYGPVAPGVASVDPDVVLRGVHSSQQLGRSLGVSDDLDGDGKTDLLISGGAGLGRHVAVYLVSGVTDSQTVRGVDAVVLGDRDRGGEDYAPAAVGDLDGDGVADLAVGDPRWDLSAPDRGGVALFLGPIEDAMYMDEADQIWIGEEAHDAAGAAVAPAGDLDGDGLADVLVGAPQADGVGHAYVVTGGGSGATSLFVAHATLLGHRSGDRTGTSLSLAGDVDDDGAMDIVIGAPGSGDGGGQAYLWTASTHGKVRLVDAASRFVGDAGGVGDQAGAAVAWVGDVNGDTIDDLAVGSPRSDAAGSSSGAAHLVFGVGW